MANLGKDDFKKLEKIDLTHNQITDVGMARLAAAIDAGGLPTLKLHGIGLFGNPASADAVQAVTHALAKRSSQ